MLLLFLFCAFRSGTDRYYYKKACNIKADGRDAVFYFRPSNSFSLLKFYLNFYVRKLFLFLLCFLPSFLSLAALTYYIRNLRASFTVSLIALLIASALLINGVIFFIRFNSLFFAARYCFVSGLFSDCRQIFSFSFKCIEGKNREVFMKKISFIPWFLCCIFLLPISFVRSFYNQTMAETAKDLIKLQYLQKR